MDRLCQSHCLARRSQRAGAQLRPQARRPHGVLRWCDTLLIPELAEVGRRFAPLDLALLPVNGVSIRPANDLQIVMDAKDAASLCGTLQARVAVPVHYRFTGGPEVDQHFLRYTGTAQEFAEECARASPATEVHILTPGEPLQIMLDASCTQAMISPGLVSLPMRW